MSDKLTASVETKGGRYQASLQIGKQTFCVGDTWFEVQAVRAQREANKLTKAIAKHDKAVHAELIAQRDRLAKVCKAVRARYLLVKKPKGSPTIVTCSHCCESGMLGQFQHGSPTCLIAECGAALAELETSK